MLALRWRAKISDTGEIEDSLHMLHTQIENEEVIERYVRNQLAPEERHAFEEHFFGCEECFEKLQTTERFVAGVRDAADRGLMGEETLSEGTQAFAAGPGKWFIWAFAVSACVGIALAAMTGWLFFNQMPKLRGQLQQTSAQLQLQQQTLAQLEQRTSPAEQPEANVPLVMLQSSRGQETTNAVLGSGAKQLIVWVEVGGTRYRNFRMDVYLQPDHLVTSLDNLHPGPYGALSASLPTDQLPTGDFRIKLTGQDPPPASLVAEYRLKIQKQ